MPFTKATLCTVVKFLDHNNSYLKTLARSANATGLPTMKEKVHKTDMNSELFLLLCF